MPVVAICSQISELRSGKTGIQYFYINFMVKFKSGLIRRVNLTVDENYTTLKNDNGIDYEPWEILLFNAWREKYKDQDVTDPNFHFTGLYSFSVSNEEQLICTASDDGQYFNLKNYFIGYAAEVNSAYGHFFARKVPEALYYPGKLYKSVNPEGLLQNALAAIALKLAQVITALCVSAAVILAAFSYPLVWAGASLVDTIVDPEPSYSI